MSSAVYPRQLLHGEEGNEPSFILQLAHREAFDTSYKHHSQILNVLLHRRSEIELICLHRTPAAFGTFRMSSTQVPIETPAKLEYILARKTTKNESNYSQSSGVKSTGFKLMHIKK